ncbi:MAG: hypothetical protein L3J67_00345 [Hyphomicrobiaceae bacterium]|nr:hypothetical protein [Hyphomicrobiaceae bacterium]
MKFFSGLIASLVLTILFSLNFSSISYAVDEQQVAVLMPQIQSPVAPLVTKIDYRIRSDHHGRVKYCRHRHCSHWHNGRDHHGNPVRSCSKWRYSGCYWVNAH